MSGANGGGLITPATKGAVKGFTSVFLNRLGAYSLFLKVACKGLVGGLKGRLYRGIGAKTAKKGLVSVRARGLRARLGGRGFEGLKGAYRGCG